MQPTLRAVAAVAASAALTTAIVAGSAVGAGADPPNGHAIFVQTDNLSGNQIVVYERGNDGSLAEAGRYATGGLGGLATGAVVDPLASQGSLTYDGEHHLLYAVNAGSNTISVFRVRGTELELTDVEPSGGTFPASVTVRHTLVYVLNAGGTGTVSGFRVEGARLKPLDDATQGLGLTPVSGSTQFLNTAGQIGFTPDGGQLVVTTKANGSHIDVLAVRPNGALSAPVVNPSTAPVPFAFAFDPNGVLAVAEVGTNSLSTYHIRANGTLDPIGSASDHQAAFCWVAAVGSSFYGANAGSANVSRFATDSSGVPSLAQAVAAQTHPGTIDLTATPDGSFLYVETGATGTVDGFRINTNGTLTPAGSVSGLAGLEGIAAS